MPAATKPNRNAPCPCGSGRKYKKCHGSVEAYVEHKYESYELAQAFTKAANREKIKRLVQGEVQAEKEILRVASFKRKCGIALLGFIAFFFITLPFLALIGD